jgi:hypothetical protein
MIHTACSREVIMTSPLVGDIKNVAILSPEQLTKN